MHGNETDLDTRRRQRLNAFEDLYRGSPGAGWDIGRPQPVFAELVSTGALVGHVLDVGCGTGEHSLLAASSGAQVTGIDISASAVSLACQKAALRDLAVRFLVWDVFDLPSLRESFRTVLDCGLFHTFDDDEREAFAASLAAVVPAGGRYHMLCFSEDESGTWGPHRLSRREIEETFAHGWRVDSIAAARMAVTFNPDGVRAWRVAMTRM